MGARPQGLVPGTLVGAVTLLLASVLAAGMRSPTTGDLAISADLPARDPARPGEAAAASAPAPRAGDAARPDILPPPTLPDLDRGTGGGLPAISVDALAVPDGGDAAASTSATLAAAPPAPAPTTPIGPGDGATPRARFESRFPAHTAATQDVDDPATTRWAVLVGVNAHQGTTRDNVGSRQDAQSLYAHLMDQGWLPDHVLLLTDELATREAIVESIHWLARRSTDDSVAVFHYSGHAKQWFGQDVDGDGESPDEGLWPTDNDHIPDGEFVRLMGDVTAGRLWVNVMACEAAGFLDPGLARDGRIITYSSAEDEKSYEDPAVGHSVWGWNLVVQGLRNGEADRDQDGSVTVQEAVAYAVPAATTRTTGQAYGAQHGGMVDRAGGVFSLAVPDQP